MCLPSHRHNLQNLIFVECPQEKVNNLIFLDGQGEELDLIQGLGLHVLNQTAQLGDWEDSLSSALPLRAPWPRPWPWPPAALTLAPDAAAKPSLEAAATSHYGASGSSGPSCSTSVIHHLLSHQKEAAPYTL